MSATRHIDHDDLALFAMQLLSPDESAAIELHVEHCADCRHELAELQGDLATFAHTVDMHSPPAQARERLMKQVAREKKAVPIDRAPAPELAGGASAGRSTTGLGSGAYLTEGERPTPNLSAKVFPWIGWAVAAGLAVAAGDLYHERDALRSTLATQSGQMARLSADAATAKQVLDAMTDRSALRVTLSATPAPPAPQGKATYVPSKGTLLFTASNLEPLPQDKTYELWLIPADGRDPIPAGTFKPDERGNASVILPPLPKGVGAKAFGVTIENDGGSQVPTMPIILAGSAAGA
jgi:anti-sigma-K factor RskA